MPDQEDIVTKERMLAEHADKIRRIRAVFAEEAAKQIDMFDGRDVAKAIVEEIKSVQREVTFKLLGLDNRWGGWEVDHTNGRTSPISAYIQQTCQDELQRLLGPICKEVIEKERTKTKSTIRKVLREYVAHQLDNYNTRQQLEDIATQFVQSAVQDVINEFKQEVRGGDHVPN